MGQPRISSSRTRRPRHVCTLLTEDHLGPAVTEVLEVDRHLGCRPAVAPGGEDASSERQHEVVRQRRPPEDAGDDELGVLADRAHHVRARCRRAAVGLELDRADREPCWPNQAAKPSCGSASKNASKRGLRRCDDLDAVHRSSSTASSSCVRHSSSLPSLRRGRNRAGRTGVATAPADARSSRWRRPCRPGPSRHSRMRPRFSVATRFASLEDADVLQHARQRDAVGLGELGDRGGPSGQALEDVAARRVGQCRERAIERLRLNHTVKYHSNRLAASVNPRQPSEVRFRLVSESHHPKIQSVSEEARVTPIELFFDLVFVFSLTQVTALMAARTSRRGPRCGACWCWRCCGGAGWATRGWATSCAPTRASGASRCSARWRRRSCWRCPCPRRSTTWRRPQRAGRVRPCVPGRAAPAPRDLPAGLGRGPRPPPPGLAVLAVGARQHRAAPPRLAAGGGRRRRSPGSGVVVVDYVGTILAGASGWRLNSAAHFAERHGLIIIVALGESIVAIGVGVVGGPDLLADHRRLGARADGGAAACGGRTSTSWRSSPSACSAGQGEERRARLARDAYSYLHLPMIAGIILMALGPEEGHRPTSATCRPGPRDPLDVLAAVRDVRWRRALPPRGRRVPVPELAPHQRAAAWSVATLLLALVPVATIDPGPRRARGPHGRHGGADRPGGGPVLGIPRARPPRGRPRDRQRAGRRTGRVC